MSDVTPGADAALAAEIADAAGRRLLELRTAGFAEPRALRAAGDRGAQQVIARLLADRRPDDAVLSEEAADDRRRLTAERVWIVDPLDGTREFAEEGRTDWAVHVALWVGGDLALGAVALPAEGATYRSDAPPPLPAADGPRRPRLLVSRTRPPTIANQVAEALDAEVLPMGSAGAKILAVVLGRADIYLHAGGQFEWDSAAPVAVARAAGLHTSRVDGSPLRYNQPDPSLPDLVVCHPAWVGRTFAALG
jgi:3'(2'), 5'-bisphosphate nucleotidase